MAARSESRTKSGKKRTTAYSGSVVALAPKGTGIRSDSDLMEADFRAPATEDMFGRWLVAQAGRLDEDLDLGL